MCSPDLGILPLAAVLKICLRFPPRLLCSVKKSGSVGEQLKEAQAINKSLAALGNVIAALATEQGHIPYRDHKLTMLMSDSIGGTAKTLMFVNVSPVDSNLDETQNSLQVSQPLGRWRCGPAAALLRGWFPTALPFVQRSASDSTTSC
jgi:hypothetical protein